ncbi:MAG: metallophosphoesterase [Bacteroidales bacterium]
MRQLTGFLFLLLLLAILAGGTLYLGKGLARHFALASPRSLLILFALATLWMGFGIAGLSNATGTMARVGYILAASLMGFLLYLLLSLALADLIGLVVPLPPRTGGWAILGLALGLSLFGVFQAYRIRPAEVVVEMPGLREPVRVVHLTDIHLGHFRGKPFLSRLVRMSRSVRPDLVFITGDLFDGKIQMGNGSLEPLGELEVPVYFVAGNHDGYSGVAQVKSELKDQGVRVLSNQVAEEGELQIIGLEHMRADGGSRDMHGLADGPTVHDVLAGLTVDPDRPTVLLHHSPVGIPYARDKGTDLYLSGHTHGGQLFPITLLGRLMYPYNKGLYDHGGMKVYVGEGAGTFGPPMRLGTRGRVVLVRLEPSPDPA